MFNTTLNTILLYIAITILVITLILENCIIIVSKNKNLIISEYFAMKLGFKKFLN